MRSPLRLHEHPYALAAGSLALAAGAVTALLVLAVQRPARTLVGVAGHHDPPATNEPRAECLDCHVPFLGTPASRCLSPGCHGELATGAPPRGGPAMPVRFHVAVRGEPCGRCHREHTGTSSEGLAFSHAALLPRVRDDCVRCHSGAQVSSHSTTDAVPCASCHATTAWSVAAREIDLHQRVDGLHCDVCHRAPSDAVHAATAGLCSTCHGLSTWRDAAHPARK
ncbi:MAG: hypothetical protein IT384_08290 [Deltaproteobacteria bacterium]|nr:hypothetical protein [Deltaproteobacteria bacterium]